MTAGPREPGHVDWSVSGPNRPFLGNGHTAAEMVLTHAFAITATLIAVTHWWRSAESPELWRAILFAALCYDILGGVVANSLNSCKRFYHVAALPESTPMLRAARNPLVFSGMHVHPIVLALLFGFPVVTGLICYAGVWLSVLLVTRLPLYLRRPVAIGLAMVGSLFAQLTQALPPGLDWLVIGLMLKLVVGHAVQEEPYRPISPDGRR